MQLYLLIGAVFIATCTLQVQASDKKDKRPTYCGFTSGFLNLKSKKEKDHPLLEIVSTNGGPENDAESKISDHALTKTPLEEHLKLIESSLSNDSLANQAVQPNETDTESSPTTLNNNSIPLELQQRIDKLENKLKKRQETFKETKSCYDKLAAEVRNMNATMRKLESEPVDSKVRETASERVLAFSEKFLEYSKKMGAALKGVSKVRKLKLELSEAMSEKALEMTMTFNPQLRDEIFAILLKAGDYISSSKDEEIVGNTIKTESEEIKEIADYWREKSIDFLKNSNK